MGNRVQREKTIVSESQMTQAIINAWKSLFGSEPYKEQVALVMAQNALETGHRKSMYNYNVGNITTNDKSQYDYFDDLTTDEQVSPGQWKKMRLKYRAYKSLDEGVKDYLKFLSNPSGRYAQAWEHIKNPNPTSYSQELKRAGYYTANESAYTKNLNSLFKQYGGSTSQTSTPQISSTPQTSQKPKTPQSSSAIDFDEELNKIQKSLSEPKVQNEKDPFEGLNQITDLYSKMSSNINKKNYFKYLPNNVITIKVASLDIVNSIEYSNILCNALDEELLSKSFVHTENNEVEVECHIPGPKNICLNAVEEVCKLVASNFAQATRKIGSVVVRTQCVADKKSLLPPIKLSLADLNHRKFLLKII